VNFAYENHCIYSGVAFNMIDCGAFVLLCSEVGGEFWILGMAMGTGMHTQLIWALTSDQDHRWQIRGDAVVVLVIQSFQIDLLLTIVDACN